MASCEKKTKKEAKAKVAVATIERAYYTARELAALIRLDDFRNIYKYVSSGKIPKECVTKIGNRTLFHAGRIAEWLDSNTGT